MSKITIYDIAKLSDTSPSTVSAALNGSWKDRRVGEKTALKIQRIASEHGYALNLQARGLRKARSGLAGFIVPVHDNRFFSSMSQAFEAQARQRGLCPVIASTLRDRDQELRTVETLIAYAVDFLFIAGASDPDTISHVCRASKVKHVYLDLPGKHAHSVVSDNYQGAQRLTRKILDSMPKVRDPARAKPYFIGGNATDYASALRLDAFRKTLAASDQGQASSEQILLCGYAPRQAEREVAALCQRLGGLPAGLFINSIRAFEGALSHFVKLPPTAFAETSIGLYDYDPVAAFLQFPVHMIRQDSQALVARAFELLDREGDAPLLSMVEPELIAPRTIHDGVFGEIG